MSMHCPTCGASKRASRSLPQHRRFFAMVRLALESWPEEHDFQPKSEDQLRRWLACKAGWYDATTIEVADDIAGAPQAVAEVARTAIRASGGIAFVRVLGSGMTIFTPRSIAFAKMTAQEFGQLCDAVAAVIVRETGASLDGLEREVAAA